MTEKRRKKGKRNPSIVVIDVGGTHVKIYERDKIPVKFKSGKDLTPETLVKRTKEICREWRVDRISFGFPGRTAGGRIIAEPVNLGEGWKNFDFAAAFGLPVRVINDAAMQALGGYQGGRMLFVGLGTAVGSTLITENVIVPIEFGEFRARNGRPFSKLLGKEGLEELGLRKWRAVVLDLVSLARRSFFPDEIVLGGGLVERLSTLPQGIRRGDNQHAYLGGCRLWESLHLQHRKQTDRWFIA